MVIHFALYKMLIRISTLPSESYYNSSIGFELLKQTAKNIYLIIPVVIGIVIFRKKLGTTWSSFEKGNILRSVIFITALILAWYYGTYNYNFYFDQSHAFDRVLLFLLAFTIYYRPIFVIPYLLLLLSIMLQFATFPNITFGISPFLLVKTLILFLAFAIYKLIFKRFEISVFVFLFYCLVGAHYFAAGFGKLNTEWILNDHISYMMAATYANGWISFYDETTVSGIIGFLDKFNAPLRAFTLFVECGVLFFFIHRKFIRLVLICAIIMHLGIFVYTGIFFWMWILLHLTALFFLFRKDSRMDAIFNKYYFILGFIIIGLGRYWASAGALSWNDAPLSYSYIIKAKTEDGKIHTLPPNFFSSYDYQITSSNFKYLSKEARLPIVWGATDSEISSYFNIERSKADILEYERSKGIMYHNESSVEIFVDFISKYVEHKNKGLDTKMNYLKAFQAPALYWTFPYYSSYDIKQKIKEVRIEEITSYYKKSEGYITLRTEEVLHIPINQGNPN